MPKENFNMEMVEIVTSYNNWYCKKCRVDHSNLFFVKSGESYCEHCVPSDIKGKFKKVNHIGEEI